MPSLGIGWVRPDGEPINPFRCPPDFGDGDLLMVYLLFVFGSGVAYIVEVWVMERFRIEAPQRRGPTFGAFEPLRPGLYNERGKRWLPVLWVTYGFLCIGFVVVLVRLIAGVPPL